MSEIFFGKRPEYVLYHINAFVGTGLGFAQCSQSPGEGFPSSSPPGRLAGRRGEQREKAEGAEKVGFPGRSGLEVGHG